MRTIRIYASWSRVGSYRVPDSLGGYNWRVNAAPIEMKARQHTMTMTMTAESLSFFDIGMDGGGEKSSGISGGDAGLGLFVCAEYRMRGTLEYGEIAFNAGFLRE